MVKMLQKIAFTLLTLIYKVDSQKGAFVADIEIPLETESTLPAMKLPEYERIKASEVKLALFKPERVLRRLPDSLYPLFHPPAPHPEKESREKEERLVEMLCHLDRIYVRVLKRLFTNPNAIKYLKVGSCDVNQATDKHFYVLYALNGCNGQRQENRDSVIYSNTLSYEPEEPAGLVVRELPFTIALECHYNKHHRSYQLGYYPEVFEETLFAGLKSGASIIHVDENGDVLFPVPSYGIGQPIYFEVQADRNIAGRRVYLNKCYISSSPDLTSTPTYTVLDNYGCLVDGKQSIQSKFYPSTDESTVMFSTAAISFRDMVPQPGETRTLFINCEMTFGPQTPTPSAKSCTYNLSTKSWTELMGDDSVCTCCDTSCPAPESPAMTISSKPWSN